ncbi:MAG: hypothetical protein SH850_26535 [Planctomycetaceae bacterium]|nr:hypothetical protein [Planctomycetaceae bacterium]
MSDYSKQFTAAAKWMYARKDRKVDWWRWSVLTGRNNDPETLGLDDRTAYLIFSDFVRDGLLVPTIASDGGAAYEIHPGSDAKWKRVMSPVRYWFANHVWLLFFFLLSSIASGFIGVRVNEWWENVKVK